MKVGQVIGGYELRERIASGGMGTIWRAMHPTLERMVAVKLIRADVQNDPDVQEAFVREARNLSRLHSPHIVQVMDFGFTQQGAPYFVTEFLEGEDLRARLERIGPIPATTLLPIAIDVLKAMTEAHAVGLVHRDLKPGNIFLQRLAGDAGEAVKVLDFGVAKLTGGDPQESAILPSGGAKGSPRYMAPEQILGQAITQSADVYSFGATIFRVLTGRPVFEGATVEVLRAHIEATAPDIRTLLPPGSCPDELADVVAGCLEKDPALRPSSTAALQTRLERLLSRLTVVPAASIPPRPSPSLPASDAQPEQTPQLKQELSLPDWFQPTSSIGPEPADPIESFEDGQDDTQVEIEEHSEREIHSARPVSTDAPVVSLWDDEPSESGRDEPRLELSSDAAERVSAKQKEEEDEPSSVGDPSTTVLSSLTRQQQVIVMAVFGLVVFGLTLWLFHQPTPPPTQSAVERELEETSAFLDQVESEESGRRQKESTPLVVKQFERAGGRPTVRLEVAPYPARFVGQKSGRIHCAKARRCQVPVHEAILVKKKGHRALLLSRDDLYDRRATTWRVVLQRW